MSTNTAGVIRLICTLGYGTLGYGVIGYGAFGCTGSNMANDRAQNSGSRVQTSASNTDIPVSFNRIQPIVCKAADPFEVDHWVTSEASNGQGSLPMVLSRAADGDVIGFDPALSGKTLAFEDTLRIDRDVILDARMAPEVQLDGQNRRRIAEIARGRDVEIYGLRFVRGTAEDGPGGAIHALQTSRLVLESCDFEDNRAAIGGAVRAGFEVYLEVRDCRFRRNDGSIDDNGFSAGAIATNGSGELHISASVFETNTGYNGGAVYNLLGKLSIDDSVFVNNRSTHAGGAVFSDGAEGGGPKQTEGGHMVIRRSHFENNETVLEGGAALLWLYGDDSLLIEDSVFLRNAVRRNEDGKARGGAIRSRGRIRIRRSAFVDNESDRQGGALWLDGRGPISFENTLFDSNRALGDAGGALRIQTEGTIDIRASTIVHNQAGKVSGGLWYPRTANVRLADSIVAFNVAGSAGRLDQRAFPLEDLGGNLEFPNPSRNDRRVAESSIIEDPKLLEGVLERNMWVRPLAPDSPAVDALDARRNQYDQRGALRVGERDIGAYEIGAETPMQSCDSR